jgi:hypothetical protein
MALPRGVTGGRFVQSNLKLDFLFWRSWRTRASTSFIGFLGLDLIGFLVLMFPSGMKKESFQKCKCSKPPNASTRMILVRNAQDENPTWYPEYS